MLKVIQGEDKQFTVTLRQSNGDPYDLTGATEIEFCFPGTTAVQHIMLTLSEVAIVNAVLGKVACTIPDAKTSLMKVGEEQTFECKIEKGSDRRKIKFEEILTVQSSIC